jgi:hypothetical protein
MLLFSSIVIDVISITKKDNLRPRRRIFVRNAVQLRSLVTDARSDAATDAKWTRTPV